VRSRVPHEHAHSRDCRGNKPMLEPDALRPSRGRGRALFARSPWLLPAELACGRDRTNTELSGPAPPSNRRGQKLPSREIASSSKRNGFKQSLLRIRRIVKGVDQLLGLKIDVERLQIPRRSHINCRFFARRNVCLYCAAMFSATSLLNCENVGQIAVVKFPS